MTTPAELLAREAGSLVARLRLWTPARFAAASGSGTRGDLVHHLAAALAEQGGAPVPLPRLDDLVLPDQLAVTADDLVRSGPPDDVARAATAHVLMHRRDLLDDDVPAGLLDALGVPDEAALAALAACPPARPAADAGGRRPTGTPAAGRCGS